MIRQCNLTLAVAALAVASQWTMPTLAQNQRNVPKPPPHQQQQGKREVPRPPQRREEAPQSQQRSAPNRPPAQAPRPNTPEGRRHAGDWLRRYREVPPEQQHQALESDPHFRNLPPQRQEKLRQRLHRFNTSAAAATAARAQPDGNLGAPDTQIRKPRRDSFLRSSAILPPQRRQALDNAIRNMRTMTPEQRQQFLNSGQSKRMFTPQEQEMLGGITRLPLLPAMQHRRVGESFGKRTATAKLLTAKIVKCRNVSGFELSGSQEPKQLQCQRPVTEINSSR